MKFGFHNADFDEAHFRSLKSFWTCLVQSVLLQRYNYLLVRPGIIENRVIEIGTDHK